MISAQPNKPQQEKLIQKLMELPNNAACIAIMVLAYKFTYFSLL